MAESKAECTDSYVLPTGPFGGVGPIGNKGVQGEQGTQGPTGDIGLSGRSKIDINFSDGTNQYREIPYSTSKQNFLGAFIYPGNTAFGGEPQELKVLLENTGVTSSTEYNSYRFTFIKMDSYALGNSVDVTVANTKILTSSAFGAYVSTNDTPRVVSSRASISALPDEQALIGLYIQSPKYAGITFKCYSAELY